MIVAVIASITVPRRRLDHSGNIGRLRNRTTKRQTENSHAVRAKICERIAPGAQRRMSQSKFIKPSCGLETLSSREKVTSQQWHMGGGAGDIRTGSPIPPNCPLKCRRNFAPTAGKWLAEKNSRDRCAFRDAHLRPPFSASPPGTIALAPADPRALIA
jgi:hypothetical protein